MPTRGGTRQSATGALGLLGAAASLLCGAVMVLPVIGIAGAGVAASSQGMAGMDGPAPGGVLGVLTADGPLILGVSVLLVSLGLGLRRPVAAIPALAAGAVLYWGMYAQPSYPLMYLTLLVGFAAWAATYLWVRRAEPRSTPR
ncbi:hypothetical protein [uncultured Pseudonocardia sp.]|jgi:hypothetical protein|uniref:hypothetical protein n=1 Tax=uncultured Pseudonocardia sp. TaxID=211455 RepID=UPI0026072C82|nr:hypothetical protein [uncultured Pseudonocardia sp.]